MRLLFQSKLAHSAKYRPEIDGLRALAVLPVLFYHAKVKGFTGGFVGVDIFYVISGYLITSIIAGDVLKGRFSFVSFYERRLRRIFPALFTVVLCSVMAAVVLFAPPDLAKFGKSLVAMTFFVSNIFFKREAGTDGYFGNASESQALLHTWSLSVEEQFYLFFPTLFIALARWAKGKEVTFLFVITVCSFAANVWATQHRPLSAFYILVPRAWELLVGSLLALKALPPIRTRAMREVTGLTGLFLITWPVFMFTRETAFPGFAALMPCLGACMVIYSGENGFCSASRILSVRPLVFIGVISYSLYLWHWPIIVFSRYFSAGALSDGETALVVIASVLMAFISFEFIESPFRGSDSPVTRRQIFSLGLTVSLLSIAVGAMMVVQDGFPWRYNEQTRQLVMANAERREDYQEVCGNWRDTFHSMEDIDFCTVEKNAPKKILFWGDSHIQHLYPLLQKMNAAGELNGHGVILAVAAGCPPAEHMNNADKGYHCDTFAHLALQRAKEPDIDTVFIGFSAWWTAHDGNVCPSVEGQCTAKVHREEAWRLFMVDLSDEIHALKAHGKRVILSLPFPLFDKSIPELGIRNAVFGKYGLGGMPEETQLPVYVREQLVSMAASMGAETFDPRKSLCPRQQCITEINGISIYKDNNHIAASQIGILEENMAHVLQGAKE